MTGRRLAVGWFRASSTDETRRTARREWWRLAFYALIGHAAKGYVWVELARRRQRGRCGCLAGALAKFLALGRLPGSADGGRSADELVCIYTVANRLEDLIDDGAMVAVVLVITDAHHPPSRREAQALGDVRLGCRLRVDAPDAFDDTIVKLLARSRHLPPLFGLDPELVKELVVVRCGIAEVLVELEEGHGGEIGQVASRVALEVGREAEDELEVDRIVVWRLPLEDLGIGAHHVAAVEAGEDEAVVAVQQVGHRLEQHLLDAVRQIHLFDLDIERSPCCHGRIAFEIVYVRRIDVAFETAVALAERSIRQQLTVQDDEVE
ncbi:hypothetical protein L1887_53092 [Cichorium endivia]|nr:hypothetical protein L1887_53092 [Cichorium endivia]